MVSCEKSQVVSSSPVTDEGRNEARGAEKMTIRQEHRKKTYEMK